MIIGVDFDGTIVENAYPEIGEPVRGALPFLRDRIRHGDKIILWTVRSGAELDEAVEFLNDNDIILFGINNNPTQKKWSHSPKAHCDVYIDDRALGVPLYMSGKRRWVVDWEKLYTELESHRQIRKAGVHG